MSKPGERPSTVLPFSLGYCIAMKALTRDGATVGYMYREPPDDADDTGWRFFVGDEADDEINDPDNLALYDVETIARLDRAIIDRLHEPHGTAWERVPGEDTFERAPDVVSEDEPNDIVDRKMPIFPIVSGFLDLPGNWSCNLPVCFFIRSEEDELVIWRAKLTMRFSFLEAPGRSRPRGLFAAADPRETKEAALARNKMTRSPHAEAETEEIRDDMIRYGYELSPEHDPQGCTTLVGNIFTDHQWILGTYQCDDEEAIGWARAVRASIDLMHR